MTTDAPPTVKASFSRRHRGLLMLIGLIVVLGGGTALWTLITLSFSYSQGERVGYVQKISRKGWICRTWEGELAMNPVPGSPPQLFDFTVRDEAIAREVQASEGKKVALHYQEKRGVPTSCFGETSYFITAVRTLGQ